SMLSAKGRTASTLLALVIGVFTLSLITMLVTSISNLFAALAADVVGGNVVIYGDAEQNTFDQINAKLEVASGVNNYTTVATYNVRLLYAEHADGSQSTYDELYRKAEATNSEAATTFTQTFK